MMKWKIEFDVCASKEIKKLSPDVKNHILSYLKDKVLTAKNPKDLGKPLKYGFIGLWRYRIDKYRIICHIEEEKLVILVVKIGKRDQIYK